MEKIAGINHARDGDFLINEMIDDYTAQHGGQAFGFCSLGSLRYLTLLRFVDAVVGNSSSGLVEAPSFKIATVNIGDRQKGRIMAESVINCAPTKESISQALDEAYSNLFQEKLKKVINPYGQGGTVARTMKQILKEVDTKALLKKGFFNVPLSQDNFKLTAKQQ